jgi:hypothetical protein
MFQNMQEARSAWLADRAHFEKRGLILPNVKSYLPDGWGNDFGMAMDAQPGLSTDPNASVPAMLTTLIDPELIRIVFAPNEAANIFGEEKKGNWLEETAMFPVVEHTGEVSSYGDYTGNGKVSVNTNWPQRQSYLYQTVIEYGERELERAGLAKISWVSELNTSAADIMSKYQNLTYFYGVQGLQNYGLLNDPGLTPFLTPGVKAATGVAWIVGGVVTATANEVYSDIQTLFNQLVLQSQGLINQKTPLKLCMSPASEVALTTTNAFNVNVNDLLKKNFPNMEINTAVQYGVLNASNPQGSSAGNILQLIAMNAAGQRTGYCAYNEKMRSHPLIRDLSSFKQKTTGGTWGAIIRQPFALAQMVGI